MVNSPHDSLFRYTFGQPEHAAALLRTVLPPEVVGALDWSTLTLLEGTRLDRDLRRHQTDLLFEIRRVTGGTVYLLLLVEHSSRVVRWMVIRMLDYVLGLWRDLLREDPGRRSLPCVMPVVVHHGREAWWAATELTELLEGADADQPWRQPVFRYAVKSTAELTPQQVDGLALTLLGKLTLAAMQFVPPAGASSLAE
ncbi:MAG: Rpn family recombination-promoting nuclease/putative transposase, partial [Planctomycetes bacterium]|nr:Rpn family recombination-promoting nuclease/putative transposase [Planctomycetota bacterium]